MFRLSTVLAATATLVACGTMPGMNTYKMWTESGSDMDKATVQLSYEYRKWENPQVDERAGTGMARERCADWGYRDATRSSEERLCVDGSSGDCSRWKVIREYQCLKDAAR